MTDLPEPEQPALLGLDDVPAPREAGPKSRRKAGNAGKAGKAALGATPVAEELPVARVVLDLQPAHLDRPYDYLVPAPMADDARPGVRVRARFGPQEVAGYVVERRQTSDHDGRLVPLKRVVSSDPVLSEPVLRLSRAVADRYAGTLADVLRLAVPPRHARVEKEVLAVLAGPRADVEGEAVPDGAAEEDTEGGPRRRAHGSGGAAGDPAADPAGDL